MILRGTSLRVLVLLALSSGVVSGQTTAITNAAVVSTIDGSVRSGMTVLVEGGRIAAVGPDETVAIPTGAMTVQGEGRYLIPGLWDMHVHSSTGQNQREIFLPLYIAHGVTGVRDLNGDCFEPCDPLENPIDSLRAWSGDIAAGSLVGPRIVASSEIIYGPEPGEASSVLAPATEEHGRALARRLAERGVDMIKVYDGVPREAFHGLLEEGRTLDLPVVGHVPFAVPASEAAAAGMRSIEHLYGVIDECSETESEQRPAVVEARREGDLDKMFQNLFTSLANFSLEKCDEVYRAIAESETWIVPTILAGGTTAEGIAWRRHPGMKYLPRNELEFWMRSTANTASTPGGGLSAWPYVQYRVSLIAVDMHRAGVPLLAGSDALAPGVFPGFGLHDELEQLVEAGLTPREALHAATAEPARYLEATDSLGVVAPGKVADLVLLDGNPLDDIRNTRRIRAVMYRGRWLDREALDLLLERAAAAAAAER